MFQHGIHHTNEIMSRGDKSDLLALRIAPLCMFEIGPDCRRPSLGLPSGFCHELSNDGWTFARDVSHAILVAGLVLSRDKSKVLTDGLRICKTIRIIHKSS